MRRTISAATWMLLSIVHGGEQSKTWLCSIGQVWKEGDLESRLMIARDARADDVHAVLKLCPAHDQGKRS